MSRRPYFAPGAARTGTLSDQPRAADMRPGWSLDLNLEWHPPQFLDAPSHVPVGSVRALDCDDVTLGLHDAERAS